MRHSRAVLEWRSVLWRRIFCYFALEHCLFEVLLLCRHDLYNSAEARVLLQRRLRCKANYWQFRLADGHTWRELAKSFLDRYTISEGEIVVAQ